MMRSRSTTTAPASPLFTVISRAVRKAAQGLVRDFGELEQLQVSRKGLGDFVSTADHKSEKILHQELARDRPGYSFILEESGSIKGENPDYCWIIDPLDGTMNYLHGIPYFCISVALRHKEDIIAGCIYNPTTHEMFWAERGKGAFMNQRRLRVSNRLALADSVVSLGLPHAEMKERLNFHRKIEGLIPQTGALRHFGAVALDMAHVAAGRFDGCIHPQCAIWDFAAGIILIREAGGYVTDLKGTFDMFEKGQILAANEHIHGQLLEHMKKP